MKSEEDEAFDDLARKQGAWGGGFTAKRKMAADKLQEPAQEPVAWMVYTQDGKSVYVTDNPTDIQEGQRALPLYTTPPQPAQEAIYGMNQDDWKDVVAAIAKVRDGRGIYLGCRPADVFQDWFLALGTAKVKEKNG